MTTHHYRVAVDAEKAQKQADKQISGMMTLGQMFQLITIDNNTASLQLRYTPGKVVFNGQEMSEEEFMSRAEDKWILGDLNHNVRACLSDYG